MREQRRFFEEELAPLFDRRLIRWTTSLKSSLFALGIPPAQYDALVGAGRRRDGARPVDAAGKARLPLSR